MATILTRPLTSDTGNGYTLSSDGTVISGNTDVVDLVDSAVLKTVKWIVEVTDTVNEKISSYEILASNHFNNSVSFNRYGIVGNRINHLVVAVLNGTDIELTITNNELVNITYKIARLEIK